MKTITVDDELYTFIASQTKHIGESASEILRRVLIEEMGLKKGENTHVDVTKPKQVTKAVREINKKQQPGVPTSTSKEEGNVIDAGTLFNILKQDKFQQPMSKVDRFLLMLGALHQTHPTRFNAVLQIKGKGRLYFAQDKDTLLKSGSSTNPKSIPGSEFWVVTNNNTNKKCSMLLQTAELLGYSTSSIERLNKLFNV